MWSSHNDEEAYSRSKRTLSRSNGQNGRGRTIRSASTTTNNSMSEENRTCSVVFKNVSHWIYNQFDARSSEWDFRNAPVFVGTEYLESYTSSCRYSCVILACVWHYLPLDYCSIFKNLLPHILAIGVTKRNIFRSFFPLHLIQISYSDRNCRLHFTSQVT